MLNKLITSKTRLRLFIKFFISQTNSGYLNGLANEMGNLLIQLEKSLTIFMKQVILIKSKMLIKLNIKLIRITHCMKH